MKSLISTICVALCLSLIQLGGWQGSIQLVHGEDKIDFSEITLGDPDRKDIVDKAIKFYQGQPGDPDVGIPKVGSEKTKILILGNTLKIFHIRMNRILDYQAEMKPEDVLYPAEGGIVAIYTPNQQPGDKTNIYSYAPFIEMQEAKSAGAKYQPGLPRDFPDYDLLYKSWKKIEHEKIGAPFGVFYPATGQYFLGYINENNEFKIIVLHDGPGKLQEGQNLMAKDVFVELAKDANKGNYVEFEPSGNPLERHRRFQEGQ